MTGADSASLPGTPGMRLRAAWEALTPSQRDALLPHLIGTTSAEYLADWLARAGQSVSASSIRTYRRALARTECES